MGCSIPGCGASDHNRRTHDKHVAPQGEALIDQPATGEPVAPAGADIARAALREADAVRRERWSASVVGDQGPERITLDQAQQLWPDRVQVEDDGSWSVDAVQVQGVHGPDPSSVVPELVADAIYESEGEPEYEEAFPGQSVDREQEQDDAAVLDEIIGLADRLRHHVDSVHPDAECTAGCDLMRIITQPSSVVPDEDAPTVMGPTGVIFVCATCGTPVESEPCQKHQPKQWAGDVGPLFAEYMADVDRAVDEYLTPERIEQGLAEVLPSSVGPDEEDHPATGGVDLLGALKASITRARAESKAKLCHHEMCDHVDEEACDGSCDYDDLGSDGPEASEPDWEITPPWRTVLGPDEPIRITLPGVYELTAEQYHDIKVTGDWFSNSDGKALLGSCPAQFDYDRRNKVRKVSDAFDFGHVWHAVILGKGEKYQVFEPKKLDGRTADGKAQKREVDAARAAGITPIYGDQFRMIEAMAEAVKADPVALGLVSAPGRQEVCLFWIETIKVTNPQNSLYGQMVQVKRRAMVDHLPDMPAEGETVTLVDGKTAEEVKPDDNMRKKIYDYAYHRQADTYAAGVEALFNVVAEVVFLFQSKKPPHLIVPVDLDTPAMRVAAAENRQALELWAECVATGEWPGYVKGIATSGVPAWIERQYEEELVIN